MERVAHLGAQGVAGAEAAGGDAVLLAGRHQRVPQLAGRVVDDDQLVAALTGVAGAAHHDPDTRVVQLGLDEGHVVVAGRQADLRQHLVGAGALDGEDGVVLVVADDLDALGRRVLETAYDLGGVGGVGDQQHVLVVVPVGDEVVDDAAGLVEAQRVLRLARVDLARGRWTASR